MLNSKRNDQPSPTPVLLLFIKQIVSLTDFFQWLKTKIEKKRTTILHLISKVHVRLESLLRQFRLSVCIKENWLD